jgi:hypothetical protein
MPSSSLASVGGRGSRRYPGCLKCRRERIKTDAVACALGLLSREGLPPTDRYVDEEGIDLDAQANTPTGLRGDQGRPAAYSGFRSY